MTLNSKAYPSILRVLDIPATHISDAVDAASERILKVYSPQDTGPNPANLKNALAEMREHTVDRIPVYSKSSSGLVLVMSLEPMFPVSHVQGAYGFLITGAELTHPPYALET